MGRKSPCVSSVAKQALQPFKKLKPDTCPKGRHLPRDPTKSRLRALVQKELDRVPEVWEQFESLLGKWKFRYQEAAERFIACGLMEKGFALFQCQDCESERLWAYSLGGEGGPAQARDLGALRKRTFL